MTELEKMRHAHGYILNLANGINPISGQELPSDTTLNNIRLARCFFYVAEVLKQVIDNGGSVGEYKGGEFVLTDEFTARLSASAYSVSITDFVKPINEQAMVFGMKRIPVTAFTAWLLEKGFLVENIYNDKRRKDPTKDGESLGIFTEERQSKFGPPYKAVIYNPSAQQFLLDNLDAIVGRWKNK